MNKKVDLEKQFKARMADKNIKITGDEAKIMTAEMVEAMMDCIVDGGLTITGLGTWTHTDRNARIGRNPSTGEPIEIPAKTVVKYKISKTIKDVK